MTDLADFARLVPDDHGLCVVSTLRTDGSIQSSVVNGGVLPHPVHQRQVVGFVANGGARKLDNLRARPYVSVVVRAGWQWVAAGGTHEDWDTYDRVMAEERRTAVLLSPRRVYSNPS
jgi:hypothetical protein